MRSRKIAAAAIGAATILGAVTVSADGGGSVYGYGQHWDELQARHEQVRITGACYSSCTMALNNYPDVCVTPTAVFGFHPAYWRVLWIGPYVLDGPATDFMRARIPDDVERLIPASHWTKPGGVFVPPLYILQGFQLPEKYRCR